MYFGQSNHPSDEDSKHSSSVSTDLESTCMVDEVASATLDLALGSRAINERCQDMAEVGRLDRIGAPAQVAGSVGG